MTTELTIEQLFQKANSKEGLNLSEKLKLSELLSKAAEEEKKAKFSESIDKIKDLIEELSLNTQEVIKALQSPPKMLVKWNNHIRMEGERGRLPEWVEDFKKLGKDECLKFVINNEAKGIAFVNNLFAEKKPS